MSATSAHARFPAILAGERLPSLEIDVTLTSLVMYAAATWDFHRYHYDAQYVHERGFAGPFVDGQMFGAVIARELMQWGGRDAFLRRLRYRVSAMAFVGDRLTYSGEVTRTEIDSGRALAVCRIDIVKSDGTKVVSAAEGTLDFGPMSREPQRERESKNGGAR
jgi:acyl dehydratase